MSLKKTILKNTLLSRIEQFSVTCVLPYKRCSELGKTYIRAEFSKHCNKCVHATNCRCVEMPISELAWKHFTKAQERLQEEEE
jgi:hypothetical protein